MNTLTLFVDGIPKAAGSMDQCKAEARRIGRSNADNKLFQLVHRDGVLWQQCHYEPGKRLLWQYVPQVKTLEASK